MGRSGEGVTMTFEALNQCDSLGAETTVLDLARMFQAAGYGYEVEGFRPDVRTDVGPEFFGLDDDEETIVWVQDQFGGWNPFKAVAKAASGVAKAAGSVASTVAKAPGISTLVAAPKAALDIAKGANVASAVRGTVPGLDMALKIARGGNVAQTLAQGVAQRVPGFSAALAAAKGTNLRQIAEEAAIGAVPGAKGHQTQIRAAVDVARGGNLLKSGANVGFNAARAQIPGGKLGQRTFAVGQNVARGGNVVQSALREGQSAAQSAIATGKGKLQELREKAKSAARQAALVPGAGTLAAAGLSAATAASEGKNLRQIAEEAAIGAVPGGQMYKSTIQAAVDVARGGNVLKSVASRGLEYGLSQIPGDGQIAQRAIGATGLNPQQLQQLMQQVTPARQAMQPSAAGALPAGFRNAIVGPNGQIIFR